MRNRDHFKQSLNFIKYEVDYGKGVNKQINNHVEDYYKKWIDMPMPALNNQTPREASKTEEGRMLIDELFDYMKNMQSSVSFPFSKIKNELKIT